MDEDGFQRRARGGITDACALIRTVGRDPASTDVITQMDHAELLAAAIALAAMVVTAAADLNLTPDEYADQMLRRFTP